MTIPSKGSRRIEDKGIEYRWYVRKKPTYSQGSCGIGMTVAIQADQEAAKSVLIVDLGITRPDNWNRSNHTALKPPEVRTIIAEALNSGRDPYSRSGVFRMKYQMLIDKP